MVTVCHVPGEGNPADLFTKILTRQPFEEHRKKSMKLAGDTGVELARRQRVAGRVLAPADGEIAISFLLVCSVCARRQSGC